MRALVVEDEAALAAQVAAALRDAGFAVDTAGDGETAAFMGGTTANPEFTLILLPRSHPLAEG